MKFVKTLIDDSNIQDKPKLTKVNKKAEIKSSTDVYEIYLGTFLDNTFTWYSVKKIKNLKQAYKEYKNYVNTQLKYTDEELKKVWDTGRLDIELRQGSKLLNWVGIYSREVKDLTEKEEKEVEKGKVKKPAESKTKKDSIRDSIVGNRTVMTRGIASLMNKDPEFREFVNKSFERFSKGDWGDDMSEDDIEMNNAAIESNSDMILGSYNYTDDMHIYIITDWGGKVTTILLPEEY